VSSRGVPNLREALIEAERLGLVIRGVRRTGEIDIILGQLRVRINSRRKDCPRALLSLMRKASTAAPTDRGDTARRPQGRKSPTR
jgi:hypothetical protein